MTDQSSLVHPLPELTTPTDFPNEPVGSVSGAHPKLLARKVGDVYVSGLSAEEIYDRYDRCFDLVNQLHNYCLRKLSEHPEWTEEELFRKVRIGVSRRHDWRCTSAEQQWMLKELCTRLNWAAPADEQGAVAFKSMCPVLTVTNQKDIDRLLGLTYTEDGKLAPPQTVVETMVDLVRKRLRHPAIQHNQDGDDLNK